MKHPADNLTVELPGFVQAKKRGRPASGNATSAAERMKKLRAKKASAENIAIHRLIARLACINKSNAAISYGRACGMIEAMQILGVISNEQAENATHWAIAASNYRNADSGADSH